MPELAEVPLTVPVFVAKTGVVQVGVFVVKGPNTVKVTVPVGLPLVLASVAVSEMLPPTEAFVAAVVIVGEALATVLVSFAALQAELEDAKFAFPAKLAVQR